MPAGNRQSITRYCFYLSENGPAVSWRPKKQNLGALSTSAAKYMAISQTCQEPSFSVRLLKDLIFIDLEPVHINSNNQGAIALVKNPVALIKNPVALVKNLVALVKNPFALVKNPVKHQKSKHVDIHNHFILIV